MNEQKYILLQNNYSISYTKDDCFKNGIKYKEKDGDIRTSKEIAESLKQRVYSEFLKKHYKNIVVLTAAGTSLDNGANKGKTRDGLWKYCRKEIKDIYKKLLPCNLKLKEIAKKKDIEALLSYLIIYEKLNGELIENDTIISFRKELEKKIAEACNLELDFSAPHKDFLNKVTARKPSDVRVQLFTTNYDTLFEQAANQSGFVIIDGFSFTHPREFAGKWFDLDIVNREKTRIKQEESFISKVFHLYKLHGSLNWTKDEEKKRIYQQDNEQDKKSIENAASSANKNALSFLPILGEGEALLVGVDFPMPLLLKIDKPSVPPKSDTPKLSKRYDKEKEIPNPQ